MWFIGVEVEQETSAPPPKKNPGSAPVASGIAGVIDVNDYSTLQRLVRLTAWIKISIDNSSICAVV